LIDYVLSKRPSARDGIGTLTGTLRLVPIDLAAFFAIFCPFRGDIDASTPTPRGA